MRINIKMNGIIVSRGIPDDWKVNADTAEGYYLKEIEAYADGSPTSFSDCGLVAQFSPLNDEGKVNTVFIV